MKKANFKELCVSNIQINISRDEKGKIDLIESINVEKLKSLQSEKFQLTRLNSSIDKFELNFNDDYIIKSNINLLLNDTKIDISKRRKVFEISQKGEISTLINNQKTKANLTINVLSSYPFKNFNSEKLNFDITVDDINLYVFNDLVKKYISTNINAINGIADLKISTKEIDNSKKQVLEVSVDTFNKFQSLNFICFTRNSKCNQNHKT